MTPQQENLAPCPFCGGNASPQKQCGIAIPGSISCDLCNASTAWHNGDSSLDEAIAAWNRRAPAPTSEPGVRDAVPTWQQRMPAGYTDGGHDLPEEVAMKAEIADLRAALATPASPAVLAAPLAPMVRLHRSKDNDVHFYLTDASERANLPDNTPLYADPAPLVAQAAPWISVDDRLPPKYEEVMVWPHPTDYIMTAERGENRALMGVKWFYNEYVSNWGNSKEPVARAPTHWMPLPPAPEASPLVEEAQRIVAGKVES